MGFGKALGIGLAAFIGLNFGMTIVYQLIVIGELTIFGSLTNIQTLLETFFGGIILPPTLSFLFLLGSENIGNMLSGIGAPPGTFPENINQVLFYGSLFLYIIPSVGAALITGRMAGGKGKAFGAWFLICAISGAILILVNMLMEPIDLGILASMLTLLDPMGMMGIGQMMGMFAIFILIFSIILNGFFYGVFAMLTSRDDFI